MLESGLKQWLNGKEEPGDFYQLVGLPRLCRDRARLLSTFQAASEYLFEFQNHKQKATRDRARTFLLQVAEARRIVSDEDRWEKYDRDLIDRLRTLCRKNPNFLGPTPKLDDLSRWLVFAQRVDSQRVEELIPILTAEPQRTKPKPPALMETQASTTAATEVHPTPARSVSLSDASETYSLSKSGSSAEIRLPEFPAGPEQSTVPVPKKEVPPPPPRGPLTPPRGMSPKSPPPPPKEPPRQPVPNKTISPISVRDRLGQDSAMNSPVLWIVMGAFLIALFAGMLGLTIAWASGAFEGGRSRTERSSPEVWIVSQLENGESQPIGLSFGSQSGRERKC